MKLKKLIAGTALALTTAVSSYALQPNKVVVFGDSLSDAGYQNTLPAWLNFIAPIFQLVGIDSVNSWPTAYWLNLDPDEAGVNPLNQKQPTWTTFYYEDIENTGGVIKATGVQTNYVWSQLLLDSYSLGQLSDFAKNEATNTTTRLTGATTFVVEGETIDVKNQLTIPGILNLEVENIGVQSYISMNGDVIENNNTVSETGTIYAAGGATTSGQGLGAVVPVDLEGELSVLNGNYLLYSPASAQQQLDNYLASSSPTTVSNTVFIIWAGANNIFQAETAGTTADDMPAIADLAVSNIMSQAETLINNGANHIVILNLPNLGLTPISRSQGEAAVEAGALISIYFNSSLASQVAASGYSSIIKIVDIYTEMNYMAATGQTSSNIQLNGSPLYFSNVTTPACGQYDAGQDEIVPVPYTLAGISSLQALDCIPVSGTVSPVDYYSNPQDFSAWTTQGGGDYLFTDGVHPSAEGHKAIQILVKKTIDENWNAGSDDSTGWNSFWDFLLQIISLGMAK
jgi:phospholipase/lecithinase/hemolysin